MIAVLLALGASVAYGASDVAASLASGRATPLAVAWWTHVFGTGVLLAVAAAVHGAPPLAGLLLGAVAGAVAGIALLLYYGALARGPVSTVTPLAASGVAVPVLVGTVTGQAPGPLGWAGLLIAAVGVLVIARSRSTGDEPTPPAPGARPGCPEEQGARAPRLPPVLAALLAAIGFGTSFVLVGAGGESGSPLWVAAGLQAGGLLALVPILLAGPLRRARVPRPGWPLLALTALLIAGGDAALALALGSGDLATVSVLGSLDSVVSVVLARLVLAERLRRAQAGGVVAALTGAVLLAVG